MILISIIIPVKKINHYILKEIIPALLKQTYQNFELLLVPDRKIQEIKLPSFVKVISSGKTSTPAGKRDLGAKNARGEILAFIDDDAYPEKNWLKQASGHFNNQKTAGVCGPGLTPTSDDLKRQVSGWFWCSPLGAGAAGTYRCYPGKKRCVDDYPTFNLLVRKSDFVKVGGFNSRFWPGEDTKLCHDLVFKLGKQIIYSPKVIVYHHRRPIFFPHLKQISRYGLHRGYFVKTLPKTSRRPGYFLPSIFFLWVFSGLISLVFLRNLNQINMVKTFYLLTGSVYFFLLILNSWWVFFKSRNLLVSFLVVPTIFLSHLVYGLMFIRGLLVNKLKEED